METIAYAANVPRDSKLGSPAAKGTQLVCKSKYLILNLRYEVTLSDLGWIACYNAKA